MNVCFTVITNNYDDLKDPLVISDGWQYVVFSDKYLKSDIWQCVVTDKHNRDIKIRPHEELFNNLTLYVDGSIQITGDLNEFCSQVPNWFTIWKHPFRNCTYDEAREVVKMKSVNAQRVTNQMLRYSKAGFPYDWGLGANGIMLRDLSSTKVKGICDTWYEEWEKCSPRDQLSLMYSFWVHGCEPDFFDQNVMSKFFSWGKHNIK